MEQEAVLLSREKGEFGEVRQLEFVEQSTKEEEVKQKKTGKHQISA